MPSDMAAQRKQNIVFISHECSLTGAPILLLNLLSLVKKRDIFDIKIILAKGGVLEEEFKKYGKTIVLRPGNYNSNVFFIRKWILYFNYIRKTGYLKTFIRDVDVVFNNTITNGKITERF